MDCMMAKRLSKALRGKRRWIGVECTERFTSRASLEKQILSILQTNGLSDNFRLMDFHACGSDISQSACKNLELDEQRGFAILEIPLPSYHAVRQCFGTETSLSLHGILTRTTSGKIRLVRERLMLPRPIRKN